MERLRAYLFSPSFRLPSLPLKTTRIGNRLPPAHPHDSPRTAFVSRPGTFSPCLRITPLYVKILSFQPAGPEFTCDFLRPFLRGNHETWVGNLNEVQCPCSWPSSLSSLSFLTPTPLVHLDDQQGRSNGFLFFLPPVYRLPHPPLNWRMPLRRQISECGPVPKFSS